MSAPRTTEPRPALTDTQKRVVLTVVAITGLLGAASFGSSYQAVSSWASGHNFTYPWGMMLPLILDGAVVASLMGAVLATSLNMHRWWMHLLSLSLASPTVYLNWQAGTATGLAAQDRAGSVAHAAVACVYIVFAELGQWALRTWMRKEGILPHDVIRGSRWIVSPIQTARIKMRMIKWEIASYSEALDAEKARLRAVATARRLFGRRWRAKIGGDVRLALSLGEVDAEQIKALAFRLAAERDARNVPSAVPQNTEQPPTEHAERVPPKTAERDPERKPEQNKPRSATPPKPRAARNTEAGTALHSLTANELAVLDRISGDNNGTPAVRAITAGFRAEGLTIATNAAMELARILREDAKHPDQASALASALAGTQTESSDDPL